MSPRPGPSPTCAEEPSPRPGPSPCCRPRWPAWVNPPADDEISCEDVDLLEESYLSYTNGGTEGCEIAGSVLGVITSTYSPQDCEGSFTQTWTFTDLCGRTITHTQTITVVDSEYPTASNPEDIVLGCNATFPDPDPLVVTDEDDNCSIPDVTYVSDDPPVTIGCLELIVRTYKVADACDNAIFVTQNLFRTVDILEPEFECPDDMSVTCIDNVPPYYTSYAEFVNAGGSASDNCDLNEASFEFVNEIEAGNSVIRTYRIEDMCENEAICQQTFTIEDIHLVTSVYLEGSLINPAGIKSYTLPMRTSLNNLRVLPGQTYKSFFAGLVYSPAGQPYTSEPWNYSGNEGDFYDSHGVLEDGAAHYPSTVVDWVLVSLRLTPEGSAICRKAALLHNDGIVEFKDGGFACCELSHDSSYYVVIEHRNHLCVMSPEPLPVIDGILTCDFRYAQSYIDNDFGYGGVGQTEVLPGIYAMFAGNGDQVKLVSDSGNDRNDINYNDRTYWGSQNGTVGRYRNGDFNMNGDSNYNDRITWEFNNGKFTSVPNN